MPRRVRYIVFSTSLFRDSLRIMIEGACDVCDICIDCLMFYQHSLIDPAPCCAASDYWCPSFRTVDERYVKMRGLQKDRVGVPKSP